MFFKWNFNNLNLYLLQTQIIKGLGTNTFPKFSKTKIQSQVKQNLITSIGKDNTNKE